MNVDRNCPPQQSTGLYHDGSDPCDRSYPKVDRNDLPKQSIGSPHYLSYPYDPIRRDGNPNRRPQELTDSSNDHIPGGKIYEDMVKNAALGGNPRGGKRAAEWLKEWDQDWNKCGDHKVEGDSMCHTLRHLQ